MFELLNSVIIIIIVHYPGNYVMAKFIKCFRLQLLLLNVFFTTPNIKLHIYVRYIWDKNYSFHQHSSGFYVEYAKI